jgi:hypothetical protein
LDKQLGESMVLPVALALVWAIGRHHSPRTEGERLKAFQLEDGAASLIDRTLPSGAGPLLIESPSGGAARDLSRNSLHFLGDVGSAAWPFYCHAVRRLRLADQQAAGQTGGGT